jgi:hypothetical protein
MPDVIIGAGGILFFAVLCVWWALIKNKEIDRWQKNFREEEGDV